MANRGTPPFVEVLQVFLYRDLPDAFQWEASDAAAALMFDASTSAPHC